MKRLLVLLLCATFYISTYSEKAMISEEKVDIILEQQKEIEDVETENKKIKKLEYYIKDKIDLLRKEDLENLEKRLIMLKESYGINYRVIISEEAYNFQDISRKIKKTVLINVVKKDYYSLAVRLKFSEDIDIEGYKEEINHLLERVNLLVGNEYYLDLIYELTGNINDIISLIEREKIEIRRTEFNRKIKLLSFMSFLIFAGLTTFLIFVKRKIKKNLKKCKRCGIEMELKDRVLEENKYIKTYQCSICGYIRKITSSRY